MEARIVDQHHHGLAGPVLVAVVVPVAFGGIDAVADEHHRAVLEADLGLAGAGGHHHVGAEGQLLRLAVDGQGQGGGRIGGGLHHRHVLEVAVAVARLQADALHLGADVLDAAILAGGAGGAAFELVRGQYLDQFGEIAGIDGRLEVVVAGRQAGGGRGFRRLRRGGGFSLLAAGQREGAGGQADQDLAGHRNSGGTAESRF